MKRDFAARALHPKPWKIHARSGASVRVISFTTREKRDAAVQWYERLGYDAVTTSGPKERV